MDWETAFLKTLTTLKMMMLRMINAAAGTRMAIMIVVIPNPCKKEKKKHTMKLYKIKY